MVELSFGNIILSLFIFILFRFIHVVVRYFILCSKIPKMATTKTIIPLQRLITGKKGGYGRFHSEFFDENDVPYPVIRSVHLQLHSIAYTIGTWFQRRAKSLV